MKRFFVFLVVAAVGLALFAGYWPEHQRRQALEVQVSGLQTDLAEALARVRLGSLLVRLLALEDAVGAQDYGQAQALASDAFDAAQTEATRSDTGSFRDALEQLIEMRDPITANLTRGDPQTLQQVKDAQMLLRQALSAPR